jgi:uncharacterized membrane protein YkgB
MFLRISLGICFLWFGVLKLFNSSPDIQIIQKTFPTLSHFQLFSLLIAIIEIAIGAGFLSNRLVKITSLVMIFSTLIISVPVFVAQGLDPRFPVLSLVGEDILKNLVIISAGLILLAESSTPQLREKTLAK